MQVGSLLEVKLLLRFTELYLIYGFPWVSLKREQSKQNERIDTEILWIKFCNSAMTGGDLRVGTTAASGHALGTAGSRLQGEAFRGECAC